jgi:hypothetical protein
MKLRIKGDSLRLRLTRGEVARLGETGRVDDTIRFAPGVRMTYALVAADVSRVQAGFDHATVTVQVPTAMARQWVESEQVGFAAEQDLGNGETLRLLIEKDFACLTVRVGEDDSDAFTNPMATC